jgi:type II secretory pathway pseudopilin PulG
MRTRAQNDEGFLLIELVAATLIISIALLALIGAYSFGYFAIGSAGKNSSAGLLANNQLELYQSLPYASIGLDSTTLTSAKASDATYSTDESALPVSGTDVSISSCGSSAQCSPVQTLTGPDHKSYKVETFIRVVSTRSDGVSRSEKIVTVVVRNASVSGSPKVLTMQTGFDSLS